MIGIIIIVSLVYLGICCLLYDGDYFKYLVKTWLIPFAVVIIALLWLANKIDIPNFFSIMSAIGGVSLLVNLSFYHILKLYNRFSLPDKSDIKSALSSNNQSKYAKLAKDDEKNKFENENTVRIKELMANISLKIDGLKKYNGDLEDKKRDFKGIAIKTIRTTYGSAVSNMSYDDCFYKYADIKEDCSDGVEALHIAQCDKIVDDAKKKIAKAEETIRSNKNDIKKYQKMSDDLQKQYEKELKTEELKSLGNDLKTISNDEQNNLDIVNKEMEFNQVVEDFKKLNLEIETRRDVEVQYGLIEI